MSAWDLSCRSRTQCENVASTKTKTKTSGQAEHQQQQQQQQQVTNGTLAEFLAAATMARRLLPLSDNSDNYNESKTIGDIGQSSATTTSQLRSIAAPKAVAKKKPNQYPNTFAEHRQQQHREPTSPATCSLSSGVSSNSSSSSSSWSSLFSSSDDLSTTNFDTSLRPRQLACGNSNCGGDRRARKKDQNRRAAFNYRRKKLEERDKMMEEEARLVHRHVRLTGKIARLEGKIWKLLSTKTRKIFKNNNNSYGSLSHFLCPVCMRPYENVLSLRSHLSFEHLSSKRSQTFLPTQNQLLSPLENFKQTNINSSINNNNSRQTPLANPLIGDYLEDEDEEEEASDILFSDTDSYISGENVNNCNKMAPS